MIKKINKIRILVYGSILLLGFLSSSTFAQNVGGGNSTINNLDQWKATSTPISAITQRIYGKPVVLTGYSAGCAQFTATGTLQSLGIDCVTSPSTSTPSVGSFGWLQFASTTAGFFDATSTLSYSTTTRTFTLGGGDGRLEAHAIKGDASDGLLIESNNGVDIGILGAGNTANVTWYGSHNFDTVTASTLASFGSSKTLQSLSTSTYPSLTELSYVKGVTSAIQTQLNSKGTFTLPSLTSGSVLFSNGSTIAQDNSNFFWDDTNNRLGLGITSPSKKLHVVSSTLGDGIRISGNQSPTIELYTSATDPLAYNWSITTSQGVYGNLVFNKSTTQGGDPANNPVFGVDYYGSLQLGTNSSLTYPSPLPSQSKTINIKSSSSAYGTGILARRGGDEATGFNIWEYGGNFYIDSYYNDDGSNLYIRTKAAGTPVTAMTIKGTANIGVGVTSPLSKFHIVSTTEQLRVGYDASNFWNATTTSTGLVKFNAEGSSASFTFADNVGIGTTTAPAAKLTVSEGDVYISSSTRGIILTSPDGTCARGTISDLDVLTFTSVTCP